MRSEGSEAIHQRNPRWHAAANKFSAWVRRLTAIAMSSEEWNQPSPQASSHPSIEHSMRRYLLQEDHDLRELLRGADRSMWERLLPADLDGKDGRELLR